MLKRKTCCCFSGPRLEADAEREPGPRNAPPAPRAQLAHARPLPGSEGTRGARRREPQPRNHRPHAFPPARGHRRPRTRAATGGRARAAEPRVSRSLRSRSGARISCCGASTGDEERSRLSSEPLKHSSPIAWRCGNPCDPGSGTRGRGRDQGAPLRPQPPRSGLQKVIISLSRLFSSPHPT